MRLSCNGCRVLRKGCSPDCPIRPSLHWIKSSNSQSNATIFLAKFYGRTGLLNLLTAAAAPHLRPAVFKSLLYEACGRIVNPVSGSTGLFSTGSWHLCEAAVEAVLSGAPIIKVTSEESSFDKACDTRHVAKGGKSCGYDGLHEVNRSRRSQFKRRATKPKENVGSASSELAVTRSRSELDGSVSRDSRSGVSDSGSVESVGPVREDDGELELELTLGWGSVKRPMNGSDDDTCRDDLSG